MASHLCPLTEEDPLWSDKVTRIASTFRPPKLRKPKAKRPRVAAQASPIATPTLAQKPTIVPKPAPFPSGNRAAGEAAVPDSGTVAAGHLPFEEARALVHGLRLTSTTAWWAWCQGRARPAGIPATPDKVYKHRGWRGYGHWLGETPVGAQSRASTPSKPPRSGQVVPRSAGTARFLPFEDALAVARSLGLGSQKEWQAWSKGGPRPHNVPSNPQTIYTDSGWQGYWLGTGNQPGKAKKEQFLPFDEALRVARSLRLASHKEWQLWCKEGLRPPNVPSKPHRTYKDRGWRGWGHWLGTANPSSKAKRAQFLPFDECLRVARQLQLVSENEWRLWCRSGARPANVPAAPDQSYVHDGWTGWVHWLDYANLDAAPAPPAKRPAPAPAGASGAGASGGGAELARHQLLRGNTQHSGKKNHAVRADPATPCGTTPAPHPTSREQLQDINQALHSSGGGAGQPSGVVSPDERRTQNSRAGTTDGPASTAAASGPGPSPPSPPGRHEVGSNVEVVWEGSLYPATVTAHDDSTATVYYTVRYDDGGGQGTNLTVAEHGLRLLGAPANPAPAASIIGTHAAAARPVPPASLAAPTSSQPEQGAPDCTTGGAEPAVLAGGATREGTPDDAAPTPTTTRTRTRAVACHVCGSVVARAELASCMECGVVCHAACLGNADVVVEHADAAGGRTHHGGSATSSLTHAPSSQRRLRCGTSDILPPWAKQVALFRLGSFLPHTPRSTLHGARAWVWVWQSKWTQSACPPLTRGTHRTDRGAPPTGTCTTIAAELNASGDEEDDYSGYSDAGAALHEGSRRDGSESDAWGSASSSSTGDDSSESDDASDSSGGSSGGSSSSSNGSSGSSSSSGLGSGGQAKKKPGRRKRQKCTSGRSGAGYRCVNDRLPDLSSVQAPYFGVPVRGVSRSIPRQRGPVPITRSSARTPNGAYV